MIIILNDVDSTGKPFVYRVGNFTTRTLLHIQVIGPAGIRIARSQQELASPAPGQPGTQGLQLNAPAPGAQTVVSLWWIGELWAIGGANGASADFQILPFGG